jgi:hypothetical protein
LEWAHENEYRLDIPLRQNEEPWNTLPYHPEEIVELSLGLAMEKRTLTTLWVWLWQLIQKLRSLEQSAGLMEGSGSTASDFWEAGTPDIQMYLSLGQRIFSIGGSAQNAAETNDRYTDA